MAKKKSGKKKSKGKTTSEKKGKKWTTSNQVVHWRSRPLRKEQEWSINPAGWIAVEQLPVEHRHDESKKVNKMNPYTFGPEDDDDEEELEEEDEEDW